MSDEETRAKRAMKFRNRHAEVLRNDRQFRMKRVESDRKRNQRFTTREWIKKIEEDDLDEL